MAAISALPAGCLLMAAGNASRFGENKLAACFDGQSLFSLALAAIPAEMFARVTVVSQYPALLEEASDAPQRTGRPFGSGGRGHQAPGLPAERCGRGRCGETLG